MTDVASLGIRVDSKQAAAATGDLDRLAVSAGRAETSTERLARQASQAGAQWQRYAVTAARAAQLTAALGAAAAGVVAAVSFFDLRVMLPGLLFAWWLWSILTAGGPS